MRWGLPILLPVLLVAGCRTPPPAQRIHEVRGQVLAVRADIREVSVAHEEIPGYMPAMSMSFGVRDEALLKGLERGDLIRATLVVTDTDAWLSTLEKTGHAAVPEEPEASGGGATPAAAAPELLEPGQPVPDETFIDQDGKPFPLADVRGRAVALTFIYTRCPLPTFCPRMDRHFLETQRAVEARPDLHGKVQFVTVSFDPAFDTPPVLKQHAASLGAHLDTWKFVTADPQVIDRFATRFGVSLVRENTEAAEIVHNLRTAVIGPDGRVVRILAGGDWTPAQLVAELTAALR